MGRERRAEGVAAAPRRRGGAAAPGSAGGTAAAGLPGAEEGGAWDGRCNMGPQTIAKLVQITPITIGL